MTLGSNGLGPLMVNVGSAEKPIWVDADAFDKGVAGESFWNGVVNGGQMITLEELDAIFDFVGPVVGVEFTVRKLDEILGRK